MPFFGRQNSRGRLTAPALSELKNPARPASHIFVAPLRFGALSLSLRRLRLPGFQIARQCGLSRATVSRLLRAHQLHRLALLDPPPPVVRYCRQHPGELIHFDIQKLARIARVGHRVTGNRQRDSTRGASYEYVHVAIDDASRIAHARIMPDEGQESAVAFLHAALAYFRSLGITATCIMSDNGSCYILVERRLRVLRQDFSHLRGALERCYCPAEELG